MTECAAREPAVKGEGGGQELPPAGFPSPFHLLPSAGTVLAVASGGEGGRSGGLRAAERGAGAVSVHQRHPLACSRQGQAPGGFLLERPRWWRGGTLLGLQI